MIVRAGEGGGGNFTKLHLVFERLRTGRGQSWVEGGGVYFTRVGREAKWFFV